MALRRVKFKPPVELVVANLELYGIDAKSFKSERNVWKPFWKGCETDMANNIAIGIQDFAKLREKDCFYIDKTSFIKEWWGCRDDVTVITRPRRFGKTLNMTMLEEFFSMDYAGREDLFEGLSIWEDAEYRELQGTYPVISLSFARVKENNYETTREKILFY